MSVRLRILSKFLLRLPLLWVGSAACYNWANPLNIVWDLDETLVSSELAADEPSKPGKEKVLRRERGVEVEHIDDDGLHFVTRARPYAIAVLRWLQWLPGCEQFVCTAASLGYMNNILELLDPAQRCFAGSCAGASSLGKNVRDVIPPGRDQDLRRTVLVDNRTSCHRPQPANGILVSDFVYPARDLILRDDRGVEVGRFRCAGDKLPGTLQVARGEQVVGKLAVAQRRTGTFRQLALEAKQAGATALVIFDPENEVSCFQPRQSDILPVLGVAAPAGRSLLAYRGIATAETVPAKDSELLSVLGKLVLCWLLPDVRWVLGGGVQAAKQRWP
mmetsp:Transcript_26839/g.58359  ORF Transcript_26839/g.58359 Transcript_26839/m.58359 type:complete len:332 (+) Transcript_26839:136-1131(+)|eukprot:CAMPEP_0206457236 /NCGR_PEP_ID=MMETSP0324_2-20121206/22842_1 /ASSEMBLY_ACC=CAM_ASM_000836 /TAXON_ID=2866 /ORGANISM="Crypthecodinium cohnii, Strain Seligo" /LENGTH=331 /DNA_ID=CAMNT_0053928321 /DNA_START=108 /DNA_END=1103 /DNA_ORIENTATION=+